MLASTMQFSKFGQRLFKPTLARENQAVRGKEAQKNGCPYLQDPTVCHVLMIPYKDFPLRKRLYLSLKMCT